MNAAVVKRTQDTLGKVIKKPPLTEKLLNKPPFRYLHDIISEVIRSTGFLKGLYGENEMKSDSVKEKDSKITFLQKAIDVVMLVTGEPLAAKPARIVAGHEPEKTNELLQAIGKCCLNKLSSDEAVKRVLAGDKVDLKTRASTSKSQSNDREGRKHTQNDEEKKKATERSSSEDQKDAERPQKPESQRRDENKEHQRDRRRSDRNHRGEQQHPAKGHDKSRDREQDKGHARDRHKEKDRDRDRGRDDQTIRERESHRDKHRERQKDQEERNPSDESRNDKTREADKLLQKLGPEEQSNKSATTEPVPSEVEENQFENPTRIPRPSSAKGQRRRPKIGGQDDSDSEGDGDVHVAQKDVPQENGGSSAQLDAVSRCVGSAPVTVPVWRPRQAARPSSARPAPRRVKRQESHTDVTPTERLSSAKTPAPVIMDGKALSEDEEDEDEQFLVEEAVPLPSDVPVTEPARELDRENHGGLVKKILETQKNYEPSESSSKPAEKSLVSEAALNKEREAVKNEVKRLSSFIQGVCSRSQMLGKIVDYIQEDVDAVQTELHTWRRENREHAQALLQEQRATDQTLETLKASLTELEQQIKDQQDKICAVKSNIMKNEEKIQKIVTGIRFSSRS
ncbi:TRAF3-interacting protein 1 isoform X1 [Nothobranchius furzeri]|uniref:TRAF3-interacting protein 1 isoform X1 n=1 Tax=Nothobranchius furzeri TaxID=105023 RepID=UPI0024042D36|nr:TRAF3-interacting protein 1 isoform X1 [Nothobranchius furzeri]